MTLNIYTQILRKKKVRKEVLYYQESITYIDKIIVVVNIVKTKRYMTNFIVNISFFMI